jgi:spore maturation protein CgeB
MTNGLDIAVFGSSLVSSYWNGAATYYRGIVCALASRGHRVTFYEPDIYDRQQHRDISDPEWARVVVYPGHQEQAVWASLEDAFGADVVIKCSGVGEFDDVLERGVLQMKAGDTIAAFWDVDAPATLDRLDHDANDPLRALIPQYDLILTYGGGERVVREYTKFGAARCEVIYNALDPNTHFPVPRDDRFAADLALLANRLPDRESRIEEFFFRAAARAPHRRFLLGGNGWHCKTLPRNVVYVRHVSTIDHNAFNSSPLAVLNVHRESMALFGFSPATRLFEAAGAGACMITDSWDGLDSFLRTGHEVLVASDGEQVLEHLQSLTAERAASIGSAARARVNSEHTYELRAQKLEYALQSTLCRKRTSHLSKRMASHG